MLPILQRTHYYHSVLCKSLYRNILSIVMELNLSVSERGKPMLIADGAKFRFVKDVKMTDEKFWKCSKKDCPAKVWTTGISNVFSRAEGEHIHVIDRQKVARHVVSVAVKRKALEDISLRPNKMIDAELRRDPDHLNVLTTKDVEYIRHNAYYVRQKVHPPHPKSIDEVFNQLMTYEVTTARYENFLYHHDSSKHIAIFTCQTDIEVLQRSEVVYNQSNTQFIGSRGY